MKEIDPKEIYYPYASLIIPFAAAISCTTGPILEYGGGICSTGLLIALTKHTGRDTHTVENDPKWRVRLENLFAEQGNDGGRHWLWDEAPPPSLEPSVVLIDSGDESGLYIGRRRLAETWAQEDPSPQIILIHDTEVEGLQNLELDGYEKVEFPNLYPITSIFVKDLERFLSILWIEHKGTEDAL